MAHTSNPSTSECCCVSESWALLQEEDKQGLWEEGITSALIPTIIKLAAFLLSPWPSKSPFPLAVRVPAPDVGTAKMPIVGMGSDLFHEHLLINWPSSSPYPCWAKATPRQWSPTPPGEGEAAEQEGLSAPARGPPAPTLFVCSSSNVWHKGLA